MSQRDIFDLLKLFKAQVDSRIFQFLPSSHDIPEVDLLYKMMRDYPSRAGKGLRPGLVLIFNRAFGGNDGLAMNTAAALELFQNWIVIHDDIEDQSDLRRGLPALHIKHGVPLALNAGDALAGKMWELLLQNYSLVGPEKTIKIIDEFLYMYSQTTEGQHIELSWVDNHKWNLSEEDYFSMCRRKTAWYTCITPCWTGAYIAGADPNLRDSFVKFGMNLGIAFQIQDDILNLSGDPGKYGKEIAGDIWEGKRTLIIINLLSRCKEDERQFIISTLNKSRNKKTQPEIDSILDLINKYGSIEYAAGISQELARNSRETFIHSIGKFINDENSRIITDLINFIVSREL